jgi:triphosphatase
MEIEAKYIIADPTAFARLLELHRLGEYALQPSATPDRQRNTYYDTTDGRLQKRRYGLRIRQVGEHSVATLKGESQVHAGLHERSEWEVPATSPDPRTWPTGAARETALALLGETFQLVTLVQINTERHTIIASRDDLPVIEMSLDRGTFEAAGRSLPFRELELELLPDGEYADLAALAELLSRYVDLQAENRSKLERAMTLLDVKKN